jgi:hypothetical protein
MKKTLFLFLALLFGFSTLAQDDQQWDTLKYQKFNSALIVSFFQSYRNFKNEFQQFMTVDSLQISRSNYNAEGRLVSGIEIIYDKISVAVGLRTAEPKQSTGKGFTKTFNANLNAGGNIWCFQNSLRYFSGFYDANTGRYDTTIKQTGEYYKRADMKNLLFRSKFLYFTNSHNYAHRAGFAGNYRQLKSAGTWIFSSNINYYQLSSDSSFFPAATRSFYKDYASLHRLRVLGFSVNAGAAATLVILKGLFINGMFIVGPEQQWRKYSYEGKTSSLSYISISGDLRFSIGINLRRCYFIVTNTNDFALYSSSFVGLASSSISGGFTFGWRFHSDVPEFYQKIQKTKFYSSI